MDSRTHQPAATRRRLPARRAGLPLRRRLAGALAGLVLLPLLTLGMDTVLRGILNLPSQMLLYLIAVVVVGLIGGLLPALASAIAAAALVTCGSGLIGLSDRVHALDGSIEVTSRSGKGTAIVAELPLRLDRA
jgi:hypothetical protein